LHKVESAKPVKDFNDEWLDSGACQSKAADNALESGGFSGDFA